MKKVIFILALTICHIGAFAQEADSVFVETIDSAIVAKNDSLTIEPETIIEQDLASDSIYGVADTLDLAQDTLALAVDSLALTSDSLAYALDSLEEDNDTIRRRLEIHPLRKGSYIQIGVGAGVSDLLYAVEGGTQTFLPSLTANIGYTYFFIPCMGIGTGAHVSQYGSIATLNGEYGDAFWNGVTDSDGEKYDHRVRMNKWRERQLTYMVEIPLALHFQQNWGYKTGMYAQIGAKFGLPIYSDYKVMDGSMRHIGEYVYTTNDVLGVTEDLHEFGFEDNRGQNGNITGLPTKTNNQFRYNISAFFEIGALFQVSKRVDLFLGIYANYGFTDIDPYKGTIGTYEGAPKGDIGFKNDLHPFMNDYQGILATKQVSGKGINSGINALSGGIKFGVNIFAGRTKPKKEKPKKEKDKEIVYIYDTVRIQDTIILSDTIVLHDTITRAASSLEQELRKSVIYFDFDKYDPKLQPADILDKVAAVLVQHRDMGIEVNGHACKTGSDEYNQRLSMKRARAVADMLRQKGVNDSQMKVQSFGSTKPFRYNEFEHQKSKDRRVEIVPIGYVDEEVQQQQAAEAEEAKQNDEGIVNKTSREIPQIEIDGKMVPIFLKYTEFIGEETVRRGMTLAQLSRKWYGGEQAFWVYIFEANMFQIPDPNRVEPGTILMIPKVDPAIVNPKDSTCIEKANELKAIYLKQE